MRTISAAGKGPLKPSTVRINHKAQIEGSAFQAYLVLDLIHVMETDILPYVVFLIVPVLGRMSDADNDVRLIATTTFATLVKLVPLEVRILSS